MKDKILIEATPKGIWGQLWSENWNILGSRQLGFNSGFTSWCIQDQGVCLPCVSRDDETEKTVRNKMQGSVFSECEASSHGLVV